METNTNAVGAPTKKKKAPYWSETEFNKRERIPGKSTNLGDGLSVHCDQYENEYFHFRKKIAGKDIARRLGKVDSMTLDDARKATNSFILEVRQARTQQALAEIKDKIKRQVKESKLSSSRYSHEDIKKLIDSLKSKMPEIKNVGYFTRQTQRPPLKSSEDSARELEIQLQETYFAVWISLAIPCAPDVLVQMDKNEIRNDGNFSYWFRPSYKRKEKNITEKRYLNRAAMEAIRQLDFEEKHCFPYLRTLNKKQLKNAFKKALLELTQKDSIEPGNFMDFFEYSAIKYSCYKSEFIKACSRHLEPDEGWSNFEVQRRSLHDWWCDRYELVRASHKV